MTSSVADGPKECADGVLDTKPISTHAAKQNGLRLDETSLHESRFKVAVYPSVRIESCRQQKPAQYLREKQQWP